MKQRTLRMASWLALAAFFASRSAFADDSALLSMVKSMQDSMKEMQNVIKQQGEEIRDLRQSRGPAADTAPSAPAVSSSANMTDAQFSSMLDNATGGASKWLKDLKFSGDLRLRYEAFHYNSGNPSETDDRNRFRYRLRYGFEKKMNDQMNIGFAMASGEQSAGANNDPNSTNTTLDNNFNFKPIFIERAWATYKPKFMKIGPIKETEITAGKMANPFEKGSSDIIWDRDIRPEGIYEKMDFGILDTESLGLDAYLLAGQFILDEDATIGGDSELFAFQGGFTPSFQVMDIPVKWLHAFSFYDFYNYARGSNFLTGGGTSLARTNPNVDGLTTELDAGKYKVIEYYQELNLNILPKLPTNLFFDIAGNPSDAAGTIGSQSTTVERGIGSDLAWAFGGRLGKVSKKGDWEIGYQYKYIGANSVPAGFNDSDFGDGFTGRRGNVFKLGYGITDNLTLNGSMFFVTNLNAGTAGVLDQEQRRFQTDLVWKF